MHAGGADAALLPQGAGRPVQAAFGQVMLDEAEDVGRFDRQRWPCPCRRFAGICCWRCIVRNDGGGNTGTALAAD